MDVGRLGSVDVVAVIAIDCDVDCLVSEEVGDDEVEEADETDENDEEEFLRLLMLLLLFLTTPPRSSV